MAGTLVLTAHHPRRHRRSSTLFATTLLPALFLLSLLMRHCGAQANYNNYCRDCSHSLNYWGNALTDSSARFSDGSDTYMNYDENQDCCWLIQPGYVGIRLSFFSFRTEPNHDTVRIYDGASIDSSTLNATFSGTRRPDPVITDGGSLLVRFTTDGSTSNIGFSAYYRPADPPREVWYSPCVLSFWSSSGQISFPNNRREGDLICLIIRPGYSRIRLEFNPFGELEYGDLVSFYSFSSPDNDTHIGTVSYSDVLLRGSDEPVVVHSSTGILLVALMPSSNGFYTSSVVGSYSHDTSPGCTTRTTLSANFGSFTDGFAPSDRYPSFLSCSWLIVPTNGGPIRLVFDYLDTMDDEVRVYDGPDGRLLGAFSSNSTRRPSSIETTSSALLVTFVTNGLVSGLGFNISYYSGSYRFLALESPSGGDEQNERFYFEASVTVEGMPGLLSGDARQTQAFREGIALVLGPEVTPEQVELIQVNLVGNGYRILFRVLNIAADEATAEIVATNFEMAAGLSEEDDDSYLAYALRYSLYGDNYYYGRPVTVSNLRVYKTAEKSESPLSKVLILGVTLSALLFVGTFVLVMEYDRSKTMMNNYIFGGHRIQPAAGTAAEAQFDSPQMLPGGAVYTPVGPEELS